MKIKSKDIRPELTLSVLRNLGAICDESNTAQRALLATRRSILKKLAGRIQGKENCTC